MITSGCGSPVENMASFSEFHLHPLVSKLQYVTKDTTHFLQKVDSFNESFSGCIDDVILATWDIESMYPSIDNQMGLSACEDLLNQREVLFPSTECILEAKKICLENNISFFNNNMYLQMSGTAMGPHDACSYADISIGSIDILVNCNPEFLLLMWSRFKDDILEPWTGTEAQLIEFTRWLNTLNPKIKFTLKYSFVGVEYLDTFVYKNPNTNKLETTLYSKPSDTHAYLPPVSCHPSHICANIPKGVALRIKRICSEPDEALWQAEIHIRYFVERGYAEEHVRKIFDEVEKLDRHDLIYKNNNTVDNNTNNSRNFPLCVDFNPKLSGIHSIINKHKYILDLDDNLKRVIDPNKIFVSFRKCKNLGDILVHSRYPYNKDTPNQGSGNSQGCHKCKDNCILCRLYLTECTSVTNLTTGRKFPIRGSLSCLDQYVIYSITDKICNKQYIGRTKDMRKRWANHKSHIKNKNTKYCNVATHYNDNSITSHNWSSGNIDGTLPSEINLVIIDKINVEPWDTENSLMSKLARKEGFWQSQLNALSTEQGLNKRNERKITNNATS